jgi:hypothetical protein
MKYFDSTRSVNRATSTSDHEPDRSLRSVLKRDRLILIAIAVVTVGRLGFILSAARIDLIARTTDDSYYYYTVARNIVLGLGVTFDGMNPSNGFHPLWMLCVLPIYAVFHDAVTALRAVLALVTVIAAAGFWFAYRAMAAYAGRTAATLGTCALLTPPFLNGFVNGLETGLLLALLFLTIWCISAFELLSLRAGTRRNVALGVLLAAIVLCRLDAIFMALGVFGAFYVRWWTRAGGNVELRQLVVKTVQVAATPVVLVGAYLAWNRSVFGHLMPISGAVKSTFPVVSFVPERLIDLHRLYGEGLLACTAVALLFILWDRRHAGASDQAAKIPPIVTTMWVANLIHFAYSMAYMEWAAHWWHFSGYIPAAVLSAAILFNRIEQRLKRLGTFVGAAYGSVGLLVLGGFAIDSRARGEHHDQWLDAALWAREHLPAAAVVGMRDSGIFGYFSERRTVNLDGVINGYAYQEALRDHRIGEFFRTAGITHLADYEVRYLNGTYLIRLPASLYKQPGGAIVTNPESEVYTSPTYLADFSTSKKIHFAIWTMTGARIVEDIGTYVQSITTDSR